MKTNDFLKQHEACVLGAKWALSISDDMAEVWDAMVAQQKYSWLLWTTKCQGVFPDSVLRKLSCRFVRETPLPDGRKVWDLLTDERSRKAVEVSELYADGKATEEELQTACEDAFAAYIATKATPYTTGCSTAAYAACSVARRHVGETVFVADDAADAAEHSAEAGAYIARAYAITAWDAAHKAQIKMIAELGNPFRKGE